MANDLRRRVAALERAQPVIVNVGNDHAASGFTAFIAETFEREPNGCHADSAARLFGLVDARDFLKWCSARFTEEAHSIIAKAAYGDDWRARADEVAEEAAARCRAVHGDGWERVMLDSMSNDNGHSRYQSGSDNRP